MVDGCLKEYEEEEVVNGMVSVEARFPEGTYHREKR